MDISSQHHARLDYLDAARAFALLLGIVFHASISFLPVFIGWAVMDISTSPLVSVFMMISHSFRLELFFLLAGFFSHMKYHREGIARFLQSRTIQIVIPLIVSWFLLRSLLISGWIMGTESMRGEVHILPAVTAGFATLCDLPENFLVGTHLWFLYYLLLVSLGLVLMRSLVCMHNTTKKELTQLTDTLIRWLCRSPFAIVVLAIPTATCLWFMNNWGMDTPDKTLIPHIPVSFIYGGFFLFGWLLHRQMPLIEHFTRLTWGKFALCSSAIIATYLLASFEMKLAHPHYQLLKSGFVFSYAIMMWSLVSLTIGLFRHTLDRPNNAIRYIADSSYWLYLIHLPIVIWLQITFAELPLHWSIKLITICAITIAISLMLYDLLVRSTFVGAMLNGKRKPRYFARSRQLADDKKGRFIFVNNAHK
ncbi:hypothetical protein CBP51_20310 [Cellvibrio mixtus]|uniref:Acyltransferase 3 domain-containing protein n=1 Tax=Cellvibrio mixtus TaxID=39650 RepID=A0A266Q1I8_9GAMM|nr:acyltransferase family protein [Cellvibrio mixtus]OZY83735.1 hypothetical protein CBP51_20310 [Cellvibrio mixtus]